MTQVLFDMNGTLLDTAALAEPLGGSDADRELVGRALRECITASMAETLAGSHRPFTELLEAALLRLLELEGRASELDAVVAAASGMEPFPEAAEAIAVLADAGVGAGVLTNSPTASAEELVAAAGLELEPVIGCDRIGVFKPHPDVYGFAVAELNLDPEQVWLVASHWWDVMGAKRAGLRGGWVSRGEGVRMGVGPDPDAEGADLLEVCEAIAALHGEGSR